MTIANIQKRKFLDVLYKLLYTSGSQIINDEQTDAARAAKQPDEREVKREFDSYVTQNRLGRALNVDWNRLRNTTVTNPDLMNELMARSILNIEVLYDSVYENNQNMMSVVSILNRRVDYLKSKRSSLERRIDDLLFSISNTDGYFYSYTENFSSTKNIDLNLTTGFIDTVNRKATISKLKSNLIDTLAPGVLSLESIKYKIIFNGQEAVPPTMADNAGPISNMFDGLTDTYWKVQYSARQQGVCAMVLDIPINSSNVISKLDGRLLGRAASTVVAEILNSQASLPSQFRRKNSTEDYDSFSFDFSPQATGRIILSIIKTEPDYIEGNDYKYEFGIRSLLLTSEYYDLQGTVITSPLSIPSGNANKVIDAVSIESKNENPTIGGVTYYVAPDVQGAETIFDFDWVGISPLNSSDSSFDKIINFRGTNANIKTISSAEGVSVIPFIPLSQDTNLATKNPTNSIYNGVSTYRIARIYDEDEIFSPYILDSINNFKFYHTTYNQVPRTTREWSDLINGNNTSAQISTESRIEITSVPSIAVGLNLTNISGYLETNLLVTEDVTVSHTFSKDSTASDWFVRIYLNGNEICSSPSGETSRVITWALKKGTNNIVIIFDAEGSSNGTLSLMDGTQISRYGVPFIKYYSYVDSFDFRSNRTERDLVFTIDKVNGVKEILSRHQIGENSRFTFYKNNLNLVEAIRIRVDMTRSGSPFSSPSISNLKIRFKNNQSITSIE